jgi:hypothetical protein
MFSRCCVQWFVVVLAGGTSQHPGVDAFCPARLPDNGAACSLSATATTQLYDGVCKNGGMFRCTLKLYVLITAVCEHTNRDSCLAEVGGNVGCGLCLCSLSW